MNILSFQRKLVRLIFVILCILCLYTVYLVYTFHSQSRDLTHGIKDGDNFQIYGVNSVHKRKGDKHSQKSLVLSGIGKDESLIHRYSASSLPVLKDEVPHQAYVDTDPSENFMDIHEMDTVDINSMDSLTTVMEKTKEIDKDFHYPEIGYRYYSVLKGSQEIPSDKSTPPQHIYTNVITSTGHSISSSGGSFNTVSLPNQNVTKSNSVQSNVTKKSWKLQPLFSKVMPPSPVQTVTKRPEDRRYLVYLCDTFYLCGGWGDRQRGMLATYLLSRVVDREFKIIMTTPCNLRLFYKPNRVQWHPFANELVTSSNISINALMNKSFQLNVMDGDFNIKFPQKVIYLKTNQDYYEPLRKNSLYSSILNLWGGLSLRKSRFHWAWSDLMQPTQMLLAHLEHIVGTQFLIRKGLLTSTLLNRRANATNDIGNSALICGHVRMGKNPTIPLDENLKSFKLEYLPTLFSFMSSKDTQGNARFFVATDYDHVRSESKKYFGVRLVDYGGKILHIDRQRSEHSACVGFEVALMDQLILSLCDILVISRSGFSISASYMSNSTGHVYMMKNGTIEIFKL